MRRRYVYRSDPETGQIRAIEVTADYQSTSDRQPLFTDRFMEGDKAPDGTDIGSRAKRAAWMRATGSADLSDFTHTLAKKQAEREAWIQGKAPVSRETMETVGRIAHQLRNRRPR